MLLIIALLMSMIVLSVRGSADRDAKLEAERFLAVVNQVRDESILLGETILLTLNEKDKEYRFTKARVALGVKKEGAANILKPRKINENVKVRWKAFTETEDDSDQPTVVITSLGEITPFELRFGGDDHDFLVFVNDEGQLEQTKRSASVF